MDLYITRAGAEVLHMYGYSLKALRGQFRVFRDNTASAAPVGLFYHGHYHDVTTGSAPVKVAVTDTGVLFGHPDPQGQLSSSLGFDLVSAPSRSLDGNGIDSNAEDPGDGAGVQPSSFHGTHVAGTIGARTDNDTGSNNSGVAGVAWDVTIIPLLALGIFGSGTSYDILQAVRYASGQENDSGTSHLVDVINLSLGGTGSSTAEQNVYTQARNAGVILAFITATAASADEGPLPLRR